MGLKSRNILGIAVTTSPKKEILEEIQKYLGSTAKKPFVIVTPNPEQIVAAQRDARFAKLLGQADVALPDGIGLAFVIKQKRIPGVECMEDLVGMAAKRGFPVALIGGRGGVAVEALECLQRKYPGLVGWAEEPGEIKLGQLGKLGKFVDGMVEKIRSTGTRLVFVGLGAPKQEYFMARLALSLRAKRSNLYQKEIATPSERSRDDKKSLILMSVGGSFDIISGRTPRAPHAMGAIGLEWLWRLVREPWRWRRQVALLKFLWLVFFSRNRVR